LNIKNNIYYIIFSCHIWLSRRRSGSGGRCFYNSSTWAYSWHLCTSTSVTMSTVNLTVRLWFSYGFHLNNKMNTRECGDDFLFKTLVQSYLLINLTNVNPCSSVSVYSYFALCEYLVILSNIAFHSICCVDFHVYSFILVNTEDIVSGRFKNSWCGPSFSTSFCYLYS